MKPRNWLLYSTALLVLGIIFSYPLMHHVSGGMPYSAMPVKGREIVHQYPGDYLQLFYRFWLFRQAVAGKISFFSNPYEFSTPGTLPLFTTQSIPLSFIFIIFTLWNNIFAYNAMVLLSFVAAGVSLTLLLLEITHSRRAAIICGLLYACLPYRLGHLFGGHPGAFVFFSTPLSLYCFERAWRKSRASASPALGGTSVLWGALSGLCFFSAALMDLHTAFYLGSFLGLYVLFSFIACAAERGIAASFRPLLGPLTGLAVTGLIGLAYLLWVKYFFLETSIARGGRSMEMIQAFSPQLRDVFGKNPNAERNIYLGIIPLLLALYGFIIRRLEIRAVKAGSAALIRLYFWSGLFMLSYLLALGAALDRYVPLYSWLHAHLPFLAYSRTPSRAVAVASVCLFVLASYGLKDLFARGGVTQKIALLAIALALFDYHTKKFIGISLLRGKDLVYEKIKRTGGNNRLLELPIWPGDSAWSAIYEYYVSLTGVPMINGYNPVPQRSYVENVFLPLRDLNLGEMRGKQYELLRLWDANNIVLHQEAFPGKVSRYPFRLTLLKLQQSSFLEQVMQDGPHYLFTLRETPDSRHQDLAMSSPVGNLYPASKMKTDTGSLVDDRGASSGQSIGPGLSGEGKGWLWYGHSRIYPTGTFHVYFNLKTDSTAGRSPLALIEVYAPEADTVISRRELQQHHFSEPHEYQLFGLKFKNEQPTRLEFRIFHYGGGGLWIDFAYVLFSDEIDPRYRYEAEDLFHIGYCVTDEKASDGLAVRIGKDEDLYMPMVDGPARLYGPGSYRVEYRLRASEATPGVIGRLEAVSSFGGTLAVRDIHEEELPDTGEYAGYAVTFELKKKTPLSFRLRQFNKALLWLDRIDVEEIHSKFSVHLR
jgi:hypothetical protein